MNKNSEFTLKRKWNWKVHSLNKRNWNQQIQQYLFNPLCIPNWFVFQIIVILHYYSRSRLVLYNWLVYILYFYYRNLNAPGINKACRLLIWRCPLYRGVHFCITMTTFCYSWNVWYCYQRYDYLLVLAMYFCVLCTVK